MAVSAAPPAAPGASARPPAGPAPTALRPLGTSELLDGAARLVARRARTVLPLALPLAVVRAVLDAVAALPTTGLGDTRDDPSAALGPATSSLLGQVLVSTFFTAVLAGLLTPVVTADTQGSRPGPREVLRQVGARGGLTLAALAVVVAVAETAGLVALAVGGVWLWGRWALAAPACAEERLGPVAALRRSGVLTGGLFWRTWGIRLLGWLVVTLLGLLVTVPAAIIAGAVTDVDPFDPSAGASVTSLAIGAAGTLIVGTLLAPVAAVVDVRLYLDARVRREGLDLVLALRSRDARAAR